MKRLQAMLELYRELKILDIGCGVGNFVAILLEARKEEINITGIDLSERLIERAKLNFKDQQGVSFKVMDGTHTDFPDSSFDVVTFSNSLHHIEDLNPLYQEVSRVLKKNGLFIISEMMSNHLNDAQISHRLIHHFAAKLDRARNMIHEETWTKEQIIETLKNVDGFQYVEDWEMEFPHQVLKEAGIDSLCKTVDQLLIPFQNEEAYQALLKEGEQLKKYFQIHGVLSATEQIVVLRNLKEVKE